MTSRFAAILLALSVPFASILVGCASSSDDAPPPNPAAEGTTGDDQNLTARPGELNGTCGGVAGVECKVGLKCRTQTGSTRGRCIQEGPPVTCLALPACDLGDTGGGDACTPSELASATCYTRSMCGRSITCRKGESVELEGTLKRTVGIGGENTGSSIATSSGQLSELVLGDHASKFVDGRFAKLTGKKTTLTGVETGSRPAIEVEKLTVCPASNAVFNCMPPIAPGNTVCGEDRAWIQAKCDGVSYLD